MMIRKHGAVQAYIKVSLRDLGCTRMTATGMLGSMTMHLKNHSSYPPKAYRTPSAATATASTVLCPRLGNGASL